MANRDPTVNPEETNAMAKCVYFKKGGAGSEWLAPVHCDIFVPKEGNGTWKHLVGMGREPDLQDTETRLTLVTFNDHDPVFPNLMPLTTEWQLLLNAMDLFDRDRRQLRPGERQPTLEEQQMSQEQIVIRIASFVKAIRKRMAEFGTATCLRDFPNYFIEEIESRPTTTTIPTDPPEQFVLEYTDTPYPFPAWEPDGGWLDRQWERASRQAEAERQRQGL